MSAGEEWECVWGELKGTCELAVEVHHQRAVPPIEGGEQVKEPEEPNLRRTERQREGRKETEKERQKGKEKAARECERERWIENHREKKRRRRTCERERNKNKDTSE